VGVEPEPGRGRALAEDVPALGRGVPVGLEVAARGVAAGAHVLLAEDVRRLEVGVELRQRGVGDRARDVAVAADSDQAVVVERLADLRGRDLAAEDRRALVVAGELDPVMADLREAREDALESVRDAGVVGRGGDAVSTVKRMMLRLPGGTSSPRPPLAVSMRKPPNSAAAAKGLIGSALPPGAAPVGRRFLYDRATLVRSSAGT
jgi:hypothetical protein